MKRENYNMTIFEKILLEERRKRRKKPVFYYYRLRKREKELMKMYKDAIDAEKKEKDPKKRVEKRIKVQAYKNRIDQNRIQQRIKKTIKHLETF